MKLADITPAFKEKTPLDKANYRPVSALPPISKANKQFYGHRKDYNTQHALICLTEKWKKILDEKD